MNTSIKIKLDSQSIYSKTSKCIFCSGKLSKKHLCSQLYIYTLLLPIFKTFTVYEKKPLSELRSKTLEFIERENIFRGSDVSNLIYKYSVYFFEDF